MQYKIKFRLAILSLICFSTSASAYVSKSYTAQRSLFIQVEADLKKGKLQSFQKHKQSLMHYPLYPYLKYELLRTIIGQVKHSELSAFITTYQDSPLAAKLRNEWLKNKAQNKNWHEFLKAYEHSDKNEVEMQCHYIRANLEARNNKDVYKYVPQLWMQSKEQPKACDYVFTAWKNDGKLSKNLLWQRIKLSISDNNKKLARHLAKDLSDQDKKIVELWLRTHDDPQLIAKPHYFNFNHPALSEIIIYGMKKIARTNPEMAVKLWKILESKHNFNETHWGTIVKEIGLSLARKLDSNATKWLDSVPAGMLNREVYDARLKLAVHHNAWQTITKIYTELPEEDARSNKWQYWHARALEMVGNREASQTKLTGLARERDYYGFLASARILKPPAFNHQPNNLPDDVIDSVLRIPGVIRAYELMQVDKVHVGRTEWSKALEDMNDQQRLAAAQIAARWEVPNWAIVALANASNKNDLLLRFPKTYSDLIHKEARYNDLDPELLFAITRQESAFIPTAKSPVGALGLMQIMPKTGKMLARMNKETLHNHHELLKPEKNIRLGSKYVRMMLDKHQQNPALAAASYNAGPHRVANWLPEYDMPTDSWIETIPYKETREYVQNVLTYAVIYQQLLGKTPRLNKYMPIINGSKRK